MTVLEVEGLDVDLGGRPVLRGVDLRVDRGELVGLLGPNGAGKTTLLRSALGLVRATRGAVRVLGETPGRAAIGYVPQRHEFAWEFPITVEDAVMTGRVVQIGWGRRPGVADFRAVDDAIDLVDLVALRERPVAELSGGQRQRVLVARALALGSPLLLLDEPFTGLDIPAQEMLMELFVRLTSTGHAVVMSTHDLVSAQATCTRLCLLRGGVVADGPPDALRDPAVWRSTFDIGPRSPLLRSLGLRVPSEVS